MRSQSVFRFDAFLQFIRFCSWLSIILETVGNLLTFMVAVTAVAARDTMTAGFAGLVVSHSLNLTQTLNWLVRMSAELESNIVCVERIKEYSELPLEVSHSCC